MSNLIYNGTFTLPLLTSDSYTYVNSLTAQQKTDLGWTSSGVTDYTSLQNGSTAFGYANPSLIGLTQFISLQYASYISQSFIVANAGNYILTFKYTNRPGYLFNNASVSLDQSEVGTVPTSTSGTWLTYSLVINISSTGTHTLKIQGVYPANDLAIAVTKVVLKPYYINNFKNTNVFGYLTVNDLNQNGSTTSNGYIETPTILTEVISFNYSIPPTLVSSNLGYVNTVTYTGSASIAASSNAYISVTIPIGIYLIDAYTLYSSGGGNGQNILGFSDVQGQAGLYYSSIYPGAAGSYSMKYLSFLNNTTQKTYYFRFWTRFGATMTKYQGMVMRIA
jgi:hypothetical protein